MLIFFNALIWIVFNWINVLNWQPKLLVPVVWRIRYLWTQLDQLGRLQFQCATSSLLFPLQDVYFLGSVEKSFKSAFWNQTLAYSKKKNNNNHNLEFVFCFFLLYPSSQQVISLFLFQHGPHPESSPLCCVLFVCMCIFFCFCFFYLFRYLQIVPMQIGTTFANCGILFWKTLLCLLLAAWTLPHIGNMIKKVNAT